MLRILLIFAIKSILTVFCYDWKCTDVNALLEIEAFNIDPQYEIHLEYQFTECIECNLLSLFKLEPDPKNSSRFVGYGEFDPNFSYQIQLSQKDTLNQTKRVICPKFTFDQFGECGIYRLSINDECLVKNKIKPNNIYRVFYYGIPLIFILLIGMNLVEKYYDRLKMIVERRKIEPREEINLDSIKQNNQVEINNQDHFNPIFTFRGLNIILLIFVQYGSGTFIYSCPWSGINLSVLVLPGFIFIMGITVPLTINSKLLKKNTNKYELFFSIFKRTFKMFLVGFLLGSKFDFSFSNARIFGVLQRISICYFFVATLELVFWKPINSIPKTENWKKYFRDFIFAIPHFLFVHLIIFIWFMVVYLLPVPGCPTGYLGPGGNVNGAKFFNCTGGATGYIDRMLLGYNHLYSDLIITQKVYQIDKYEPEGIWGTLPSICLAYYGVIAGRIILFYNSSKKRLIYWLIWALITFLLFGILCQFDLKNGWLPVNKNIWTFTFTLIMASLGYLTFAFLYFLVEYKKLWTGAPFRHVGINSTFIYICLTLFNSR